MQWQLTPLDAYSGNLWQDWQSLVERKHAGNPMLSSAFVELLVEYFAEDLYLAAGYQGAELQVMGLLESRGKGIWRVFKPSQAQVALWVGDAAFNMQQLIARLPGTPLRLDFYSLDPLEHKALLGCIQDQQLTECAVNMRIAVSGEFDSYWSQRPKKLRQNLKRYRKRLIADFTEYRLECHTEPEAVAAATDRYGLLEIRGWKGKVGTALHPANTQGQFYQRLMRAEAARGQARVYEIYIGEQLVASRLCLLCTQLLVTLKTTYDENYRKQAVGRILLFDVLESLFTDPEVAVVDFYTNATSEQLEWCTERRPMFNASVYAESILGMTANSLVSVKSALRKRFTKESA